MTDEERAELVAEKRERARLMGIEQRLRHRSYWLALRNEGRSVASAKRMLKVDAALAQLGWFPADDD